MALCPSDAARLELSRLGAELNIGASSAEWIMVVLYAEARGIFGTTTETERAKVFAQMDRIESRVDGIESLVGQVESRGPVLEALLSRSAKQEEPSLAVPARDLTVFAIALLTCVAVVMLAIGLPSTITLIAAFVLGLCCALVYLWLQPIVSRVIIRAMQRRR